MSSYATLYIRCAAAAMWRNEIDPTYLFLFRKDEVCTDTAGLARLSVPPALVEQRLDEDDNICAFAGTAGQLIDRLDALGVSTELARTVFDRIRDDEAEWRGETVPSGGDEDDAKASTQRRPRITADDLRRYDYDSWLADVSARLDTVADGRPDPRSLFGVLAQAWDSADALVGLRAHLDAAQPDDAVVLDMSDLIAGGWADPDVDPHEAAVAHFESYLATGAPAIVVTEGTTDVRVLKAAIDVLMPHLAGYIRFLDFSFRPEGGAAAAVRMIKAFAAAGVANRVVLLLDNDAAAWDARHDLNVAALPARFQVTHYPRLPLAAAYPTIGPAGPAVMDVNGLAGSIEMYLGRDVLTGDDGTLLPVTWKSRIERVDSYQGEVSRKAEILARFNAKAEQARRHGRSDDQDWTGLQTVLDSLLRTLAASPATA